MKINDRVVCIKHTTTGTDLKSSPDVEYVVTGYRSVNYLGCGRDTINLKGFTCYFYADEFKLIALTIPEMENRIKEIKDAANTEMNILSNKISYLQLSDSGTFDETEFKVFSTLQELKKSDNDDFAKAKAIAKLIDN